MEVYENTIIYIMTPAHIFTGGPNSCHQLCYKLRMFNFKAFIYYYDVFSDKGSLTHPNYLRYRNPVAEQITDETENIVIMPETRSTTGEMYQFVKARKAIWWLSVDFYYDNIYSLLKLYGNIVEYYDILSPVECWHFTDSEYARRHLELFSIRKDRIMPLHSYLHPIYVNNALFKPKIEKQDYVTFNPKKGIKFTEQIILYCKMNGYEHIKFIPLENLSQEKLCSVYKMCKVHIDFGGFPGREYIPREAAINDCCIITGLRGAAKYYEDVPIPDEYKFECIPENLPKIVEYILACLNDYESRINDFKTYKQFALNLEKTFEQQIKSIFIKKYDM